VTDRLGGGARIYNLGGGGYKRDDRGDETETPKALRNTEGVQREGNGDFGGGLGERRKLPSGIWGGALAENDFSAFSAQ